MTRVRFSTNFTILTGLAVTIILVVGGCTPGPASISGRVSFEHYNDSRPFPPLAIPNAGTDDVLYIRLMDNDGAGAVLLTNEAIPTLVASLPATTTQDGVFIDTFLFAISNTIIDSATMPLRLEAYLYDVPVAAPIDPATDAELYSVYVDPATSSAARYFAQINIQKGDIKGGVSLVAELAFP